MKDFKQAFFASTFDTVLTLLQISILMCMLIASMWPQHVGYIEGSYVDLYEYPTRWVGVGIAFGIGVYITARYIGYQLREAQTEVIEVDAERRREKYLKEELSALLNECQLELEEKETEIAGQKDMIRHLSDT